jgi:hypothetical protein
VAVLLGLATVAAHAGVAAGVFTVRSGRALEANLVLTGFTTLVVFAEVFRSRRVTSDVLAGAVAGYVLLGLTWASAFAVLEAGHPLAFTGGGQRAGGILSYRDLVYFSFITLMSVGFGDITPLSPMARALVVFEGLTGVAFNTIVLALLVSKYLVHSERGAE